MNGALPQKCKDYTTFGAREDSASKGYCVKLLAQQENSLPNGKVFGQLKHFLGRPCTHKPQFNFTGSD